MKRVFMPRTGRHPGILVLSGLDGTGKSTQARILSERLSEMGIDVATVWNRWKPLLSAPVIRVARRRLSSVKDAPTSDYSSFTRAKKEKMRNPFKRALWQIMVWGEYAIEVGIRLLRAGFPGKGIICDRYVYDTMVDMAINFSITPSRLPSICGHPLLGLFPRPAQVILIDIDPTEGSRRKDDGTPRQYLADRRAVYLEMARITGADIIDGEKSIEEIAERIWDVTGEWRAALDRRTSSRKG